MFCLDVEFASFRSDDGPTPKKARTEAACVPGLKLTKERPAARVYLLEVVAGSSWTGDLPFARMLWIVHRGARVEGDLGDRMVQPADARYEEGPRQMSIKVLGHRHSLALWIVELL